MGEVNGLSLQRGVTDLLRDRITDSDIRKKAFVLEILRRQEDTSERCKVKTFPLSKKLVELKALKFQLVSSWETILF